MNLHTREPQRTSRRIRAAAAFLIAGVLVAACGSDDDGSASPTSAADAAATTTAASGEAPASTEATPDTASATTAVDTAKGDPDAVIKVGAELSQPTVILDPAYGTVSREEPMWFDAIYDTIIGRGPDGEPVPTGLAKSYTFPDPSTIELVLNEGITFHDGTPLDADAVKFSFDRAKASFAAGTLTASGDFKALDSVEVVSDLVARVHLSKPVSAFFVALMQDADVLGVVSPTAVQKYGETEFRNHPVGAGPYAFKEYVTDQKLSLVRNDSYWNADRKPALAGVDFIQTPFGAPRVTALNSRGIDLAMFSPEDQSVTEGLEATVTPGILDPFTTRTATAYLCMSKPPFDDPQVRQGVALAIDRDAVNDAIYGGKGLATAVPLPTTSPYYDPDLAAQAAYDVDKARELVEAGGGNGAEITLLYRPIEATIAEVVQQQLADVGISATLQLSNDIVTDLPRLQPEMFIVSPGIVNLSALTTPGGVSNICGWNNETLLAALATTNDLSQSDAQLTEAWATFQTEYLKDNVLVSIVMAPALIAHSDKVGGIDPPVDMKVNFGTAFVSG